MHRWTVYVKIEKLNKGARLLEIWVRAYMIDYSINLTTKEKKKKKHARTRGKQIKPIFISFVQDQVASFISDSRKLRREKKSAHA